MIAIPFVLPLLLAALIPIPTPTPISPLTCRVYNVHGIPVRSHTRRTMFLRSSGYPHGRPGYVVDHILPLCAGGCDTPTNMQWQTVGEAKLKDRWEDALCDGRTTMSWADWQRGRR